MESHQQSQKQDKVNHKQEQPKVEEQLEHFESQDDVLKLAASSSGQPPLRTPQQILQLQRLIGNQATQRLLADRKPESKAIEKSPNPFAWLNPPKAPTTITPWQSENYSSHTFGEGRTLYLKRDKIQNTIYADTRANSAKNAEQREWGYLDEKNQSPNPFAKKLVLFRNSSAIQRMVLNLDKNDTTITAAAAIAWVREQLTKGSEDDKAKIRQDYPVDSQNKDDKENAIKAVSDVLDELGPLGGLGEDEALTLVAHGEPLFGTEEPMVAGKTVTELLKHLTDNGFASDVHKGQINLSNCTTAWKRWGQKSFAERFQDKLIEAGYNNRVTGFKSFVTSDSIDNETEAQYDLRESYMVKLFAGRILDYSMELLAAKSEEAEVKSLNKFPKVMTDYEQEKAKMEEANWENAVAEEGKDDKDALFKFYSNAAQLLNNFYFHGYPHNEGLPPGLEPQQQGQHPKRTLIDQFMEQYMTLVTTIRGKMPDDIPNVPAKKQEFQGGENVTGEE